MKAESVSPMHAIEQPALFSPALQAKGPGKTAIVQNGRMKQLLRLLRRWTGQRAKPPLHTPEELECFKTDAIDNRGKHY